MSVSFYTQVFTGVQTKFKEHLHAKIITKYDEHTGKPYEKKVSYSTYTLFDKEYTAEEKDELIDKWTNKSPYVLHHLDYDSGDFVLGHFVDSLDPQQSLELPPVAVAAALNNAKDMFLKFGFPIDNISLIVYHGVSY